jgi:UDP-glucose 4-epimerase
MSATRVVVTGAAGVLGSGVAAGLAGEHDVRGVDLRPLPARAHAAGAIEEMLADLTDPAACDRVVAGADVVVHCASIHPWKEYEDGQYWDLNVKATHHLLAACVAARVRKVVLTSSVEPFAGGPFAPEELPLQEDVVPAPRRLYGLTKQIGEQVAERFHRVDGLCCVALRPATFIPYQEDQIGPRLLNGTWLYPEDVIAAHTAAVAAPPPPNGWDAYFIAPETPYSPADVALIRQGGGAAEAAYERRYPGTVELFRRHGLGLPPMNVFYSVERARRALSWRPERGFADWLALQRPALPGQLVPSFDRERWLR